MIYLGYPVYTSAAQRNSFVDQLLLKVQTACTLHTQRSLSIRGRVTVLNTMLFSKLWHVLRVLSLASAQRQRFREVASAFLNGYRFPKISFVTLSLPRDYGGVGALGPHVQQMTLQ